MDVNVSVIIVNLNACQLLEECLGSIYEHTRDVTFEVIVVDNHSSDNSVAMVKAGFPRVRLVENALNNRYAIANNQGLAVARGRYVLYLNSDILLLGNTVEELYRFLETHEDAGAVGGRLIYADGSRQNSCFRFPSALNLFYLSCLARFYWKTRLAGNYRLPRPFTPQRVDFITGACLMVRRDILSQCQGMDEDYYLYGEDSDLCYRIREMRWGIYYLPTRENVIHHGGKSTQYLLGSDHHTKRLWGWKSRFLFVKKHYPLRRRLLIAFAMLKGFGVNVLLYGLVFLKRRDWNYTRRNLQIHWEITREAFKIF